MSNGKNLQKVSSGAVTAPVSFAVFARIISIAIIIIIISSAVRESFSTEDAGGPTGFAPSPPWRFPSVHTVFPVHSP